MTRSKLFTQERKAGSSTCNSPRCLTCSNIKQCDTFTSRVTKQTFKINYHFNRKSQCLIYLFSCKVCGNNMSPLLLIRLGTNWGTIRTANIKEKEEKIICENIYRIIFKWRSWWVMLRLLWLITLIHRNLKEDRNFGGRSCAH